MGKWVRANLDDLGVFKWVGIENLILEYLKRKEIKKKKRYFSPASGVNLQRKESEACEKTSTVSVPKKEERGGVGELESHQLNINF